MRHLRQGHKRQWMPIVGIALATAIALLGVVAAGNLFETNLSNNEEKLLVEILDEVGFEGGVAGWLEQLTDEQLAFVDIDFSDSVDEGYGKSKEEWVAEEVHGRIDAQGNIVVLLPGGGKFTFICRGNESPSKESSDIQPVAEGMPRLIVDCVRGKQGESRVAVPVRIASNPGVLGLTVAISYDENILTLVDADNGAAFSGVLDMTHSRTLSTGCLFTWDGLDAAQEDIVDGVILILYFDINPNAAGLSSVAVRTSGSAYDKKLHQVSFVVEDGGVVVE